MIVEETELMGKDQNCLSSIVPIFVYSMPCACLTGDDVRLLMKLKKLYENYAVLFCIGSLANCPYVGPCEHQSCTDISDQRLSESLGSNSPSCSSSSPYQVTPPDEFIDDLNARNALNPDHCDHLRRDPFSSNVSKYIAQEPTYLEIGKPIKSSRPPPKFCVSKPDQLQLALEEIGFSIHQVPTIKPRETSNPEQNKPTQEKQPNSVIYFFDDRRRTIRPSIQGYVRKVLQFHITKAAKVLNRYDF